MKKVQSGFNLNKKEEIALNSPKVNSSSTSIMSFTANIDVSFK